MTISRESESPNGFFSPFPYNMIVIYESAAEESLDSWEKSIESVFYHELSHAISLNLKSPFWSGMSCLFGDFFNPAYVNLSFSWIEGLAVLFESSPGMGKSADSLLPVREGRLSSSFFTQLVSQAKIDCQLKNKRFPDWRDLCGSRDTYPGGSDRYAFGGCFACFLVESYGGQKYIEFWQKSGRISSLSFSPGIFKKIYGISMNQAWKDFYNWIPSLKIQDKKLSLISKEKSIVKAMDSFFDVESGLFKVACFDSKSDGLYLVEEKNGVTKGKRLLSIGGVRHLSFSPDGKSLLISRIVTGDNLKYQCGIYDFATGKYKSVSQSGKKDGFYDSSSLMNFLDINDQIDSSEKIFSPLDVDGKMAFISKKGLVWSIVFDGRYYCSDENLIIHNLHLESKSAGKISLVFSWCYMGKGLDMLPRIGRLEIHGNFSASLYLQKENISPGIIDAVPCKLNFPDGSCSYLISAFEYDSSPLYKLTLEAEDFLSKEISPAPGLPQENLSESDVRNENQSLQSFSEGDYSPWPYFFKGCRLPLGLVPMMNSDYELSSLGFLGASYLTSSPWLNDFFGFSAGYDPLYKYGGGGFFFYGFDSSLSYLLGASVLFDRDGFLQGYGSLSLSKTLFRGLSSSVSWGGQGQLLYGCSGMSDVRGLWSQGRSYIDFSNYRKSPSGQFQKAGFSFQTFLSFEKDDYNSDSTDDDLSDIDWEKNYVNVGSSLTVKFPGFTDSSSSWDYLPLTLKASIFPSSDYFAFCQEKVTLFSREVQRGIPALSLYVARFSLFASYSSWFSYDCGEYFDIKKLGQIISDFSSGDYSDKLSIGCLWDLNPNTGVMADPSAGFNLVAAFNYYPNPENENKWAVSLSLEILDLSLSKNFY